jgi:hypothetical protein
VSRVSRHLCSRCGAVVDDPDPAPGQQLHGACPECGLGFVSRTVVATLASGSGAAEARASARRVEAARRALAERTFPVHGIDGSWRGRRWIGGWGRSGVAAPDRVRSVTLAHGDVSDPAAPLVLVESRTDEGPERFFAGQELAASLFHETGEHTPEHRQPYGPGDPDTWWDPLTLPVDGEPAPFRLLRSGAHWVALGAGAGCLIAIVARHGEPGAVRLVTIRDPEPYLEDDGEPR